MSHWKSSGFALFASVCLLGGATSSARAQCDPFGANCATEWSGGERRQFGRPAGLRVKRASGVNDAGQIVGTSAFGPSGQPRATEWSGGSIIDLGGLPGSTFNTPRSKNDAGQVVGTSSVGGVVSPPSGAAAASSTWEDYRVPRVA
jgi:probable HAF family extracellular repeat protein